MIAGLRTSTWLDPMRAALDESAAPCPVFFRDDDAGWDNARLGELLDVFARHDVAVDVAVIPAALGPPLSADLRARADGASVHLHQHGYAHLNHEPAGRKHEFGPSRGATTQEEDIARGRLLLRDALGGLVEPVFTPPWNRCTSETANALVAQGFEILSRDHTAPVLGRAELAEVPVTVDWFGHHKGERWTREALGHRLACGVEGGAPVGVLLHHAVSDADERAAIDDLVALVTAHPHACATTIVELARRLSAPRT